jgi:hypothetical protein
MSLLDTVLVLCVLGQEPKPKPLAMVVDAGTEAKLQRGEAARKGLGLAAGPQSLRDVDLLYPGDTVEAGKGGVLVVFLKGGARERVQPGRKATVQVGGCQPGDAVQLVTDSKLPAAAMEALPELRGRERAGVATFRDGSGPAVSPLRESIVPTTRPTLGWPTVPKAGAYEVRLFSGEGMDRKLEWKATAKEPRLPYPEGKPVLARGKTYHWEVTAVDADGKLLTTDGKPNDPLRSKFTVATQEEERAAEDLRALAAGDDPSGWLLAATLYDAYGLLNEALPLFEKVAEKRIRQGNVQAILAGYYGLAGQPEKSAAARKKAEDLGVKTGKE